MPMHDAADREDQRADQQNPHQLDGLRLLLRRETGRDDVRDQPGRGEEGDDADQQRRAENRVDDVRGGMPRAVVIAARQKAAEDRDEGVRQRAARDQREDQFGDAVGADEGIPLRC